MRLRRVFALSATIAIVAATVMALPLIDQVLEQRRARLAAERHPFRASAATPRQQAEILQALFEEGAFDLAKPGAAALPPGVFLDFERSVAGNGEAILLDRSIDFCVEEPECAVGQYDQSRILAALGNVDGSSLEPLFAANRGKARIAGDPRIPRLRFARFADFEGLWRGDPFKSEREWWQFFDEGRGPSGLVRVTRAVIDEESGAATLLVDLRCGSSCGAAFHYTLVKKEARWATTHRIHVASGYKLIQLETR